MTPMIEHKTFAITKAKTRDDGAGVLEGYGATFGNVDQGGDVIQKGAFTDALPSFLERGFVPVGHDWLGLPVATIASAKEDDEGLWFTAEFHSTAAAQDARTVVKERMDRGKFVGLSIGFLPDYEEGVSFRDDGVRVLSKIKELAEISIVTVPMNRQAGVAAIKSLTFTDEADTALAAVKALIERAGSLADLRVKEGRTLSSANRTRLSGISEQMREAATSLDSILAETDPDKDKPKITPVEMYRLRSTLHDVDLMLAEAV
jgi:HK97 family phage prohead protease